MFARFATFGGQEFLSAFIRVIRGSRKVRARRSLAPPVLALDARRSPAAPWLPSEGWTFDRVAPDTRFRCLVRSPRPEAFSVPGPDPFSRKESVGRAVTPSPHCPPPRAPKFCLAPIRLRSGSGRVRRSPHIYHNWPGRFWSAHPFAGRPFRRCH